MIASLARLVARFALNRPIGTLIGTLAVGIAAGAITSTLEFDARFAALLPEGAPELTEVRALQRRAGGTVELVIAIGGPAKARLQFARRVVKVLRGKPWIRRADVEFPVEFFADRRLYLLPLDKLTELKRVLEREVRRAKARANPLFVDLEEDGPQPTSAPAKGARRRAPWADVEAGVTPKGKRGLLKRTFASPDGKYLFVRVKPVGTSFDMGAGRILLRHVTSTVAALKPGRSGVEVRYAGGLVANQEQHRQMLGDLHRASLVALVLVLLLMTLHVRRVVAPVVLAVPLAVGVAITLAITALTIGQLNLVSGFLVSALIGLGIDFEIHLYLRYLEELAASDDRVAAMRKAIERTLPGCVTAGLTTSAAFFAMAVSDFRGFREYGVIAGLGVLVALVVTFFAMPSLAVFISRTGYRARPSRRFGGFNRGLAWAMVLVGVGLSAYAATAIPEVRWRSNFKQLRGRSDALTFHYYVEETLGGSLAPAGILVETLEQARRVERYLERRKARPDSGIKRYISLASMVPQQAAEKRRVLRQMERVLEDVRDQPLERADRRRVRDALKLVRAKPWTVDEIPDVFRRQFETVDGKAQFVVVWPRLALFEDREVMRWGAELEQIRRELRAAGTPVQILDEHRIGARVLREMREDAPYVMLAAALAVVLFLTLDFRRPWPVLAVAGSLAVGMLWMVGVMHVASVEVNVFNQAVLATIIGLGLDNAVHVQHRYSEEGPGSLPKVVATTGSASFLASATTAIGFGAAIGAHHLGIQSLGWLAVIGLGCTFVSSTVFFPALLRLLERDVVR